MIWRQIVESWLKLNFDAVKIIERQKGGPKKRRKHECYNCE